MHLASLHNEIVLILAIDLLEQMLAFNPRSRPTATQCLEHEYLTRFHDPSEEPEAAEKFDWSFNNTDLSADAWKVHITSMIDLISRSRCTARFWSSIGSVRWMLEP